MDENVKPVWTDDPWGILAKIVNRIDWLGSEFRDSDIQLGVMSDFIKEHCSQDDFRRFVVDIAREERQNFMDAETAEIPDCFDELEDFSHPWSEVPQGWIP